MMKRRSRMWTALIVVGQLCACAVRRQAAVAPSAARPSAIGVVQAAQPADGNVDVGAPGMLARASHDAGEGALFMASGFGGSPACSGESCAIVLAIMAGSIVTGGLVGAVIGAVRAVPVETAEQIAAQLSNAIHDVDPNASVEGFVLRLAPEAGLSDVYKIADASLDSAATIRDGDRVLSRSDVGTIVEIGAVQIELVGDGGSDPILTLEIHTIARFVDARTNLAIRPELTLSYSSPKQKFSNWSADDQHQLESQIELGYATLARSVVDELVLGAEQMPG